MSTLIRALLRLVKVEWLGVRMRRIDRRSRKLSSRRDRDSVEWGELQTELSRCMRELRKLEKA